MPTYYMLPTGEGAIPPGSAQVIVSSDNPLPCYLATGISVTIGSIEGEVAHDAAASGTKPLLVGAYSSAAAPADVSADNDATNLWCLRNGSLVVNMASGGTLILSGTGTATGALRTVTASNSPDVTALEIMDDWDESDRAKVNIIAGQAGVTAGAGAVAANTPRTTLASDDPAVVALQIMDDWDESDRAKVNPIVGQAGVAAGAGTVGATTQRVCFATDANRVIQGGLIVAISAEKTRPANTTAYAAKDVINESDSAGTVWTFSGAARANGLSGDIVGALLSTDQGSNTASYRLHLYTTSITAINDNAQNTVLYANAANYLGYIQFGPLITEGSGSGAFYQAIPGTDFTLNPFVTGGSDSALYGVLETTDGFTPASGQKLRINLKVRQD